MTSKIDLNITACVIEIKTGDLDGNTQRIIDKINSTLKVFPSTAYNNIIVFPETAISGYCCGSLFDMPAFILEQEEKLKLIQNILVNDVVVIVGYVRYMGIKKNGFPRLRNSVAAITRNNIINVHDKIHLANSDHHEDKKYFDPGKEIKLLEHTFSDNTFYKIGIPICEDSWYKDHDLDVPSEMKKLGADMLISINQSYFYHGKQQKRKELFSGIATNNNVPVITVNAMGIGDIVKNILIYDGGSMFFNKEGILVKNISNFISGGNIISWSKLNASSTDFRIEKSFQSKYEDSKRSKYDEIFEALVYEQKTLFNLLGLKFAQVHLSGGLDSSIVAAIVFKAMGKGNTIFITNPTDLNDDSLKYVKQLTDALETEFKTHHMQEIVDVFKRTMENDFSYIIGDESVILSTIHAVGRTVSGLATCHIYNSGIVATGNHTEIVLGWANFHDIGSIGVHSIIGDLSKTELFEFSDYINRYAYYGKEIIPIDLYDGKFKPAAELPDAKEDPIDYVIQSFICEKIIRDRYTTNRFRISYEIKHLPKWVLNNYDLETFMKEVNFAIKASKRSVFKAAQAAPIVITSPRSRGFSNRETILNKYHN